VALGVLAGARRGVARTAASTGTAAEGAAQPSVFTRACSRRAKPLLVRSLVLRHAALEVLLQGVALVNEVVEVLMELANLRLQRDVHVGHAFLRHAEPSLNC